MKFNRFITPAILSCTLFLLAAQRSQAANIVTDGGFENAATGYVDAPSFLSDNVWKVTSGEAFVSFSSGSNIVSFGQGTTIVQILTTIPGQAYDITVFAQTGPVNEPITVTFGSQSAIIPVNRGAYAPFTFSAIAAGNSTVLSIGGDNGNIDNVSATPTAASAVPEPALVLPSGLALIAVFAVRGRRRASRAV